MVECRDFALSFSSENDIVKSPEWANLRPENGIDGAIPGIKQSPEHIAKRMTRRKRGPMPQERKDKISSSLSGKKGSPHSEYTRLKMSIAARGAANGNFGKNLSAEEKNNISNHQKRLPKSEKTKASMRIGASLRQLTVLMNVITEELFLVFKYNEFCKERGISKYKLERHFNTHEDTLVNGWLKTGRYLLNDIQKDYFVPFLKEDTTWLPAKSHLRIIPDDWLR